MSHWNEKWQWQWWYISITKLQISWLRPICAQKYSYKLTNKLKLFYSAQQHFHSRVILNWLSSLTIKYKSIWRAEETYKSWKITSTADLQLHTLPANHELCEILLISLQLMSVVLHLTDRYKHLKPVSKLQRLGLNVILLANTFETLIILGSHGYISPPVTP